MPENFAPVAEESIEIENTSNATQAIDVLDYLDENEVVSEEEEDTRAMYRYLRRSYIKIFRYLHKTWIDSWRKKIIKCYTNRFLHLGTTTTSRVESAHKALKVALGFSTGDLYIVVNAIELLLTN